MSKQLWKILKTTPAIVGASVLMANAAIANENLSIVETNSQDINIEETELSITDDLSAPTQDFSSENETLNTVNEYTEDSDGMSQVTNVSQFRDVSPTDWAYEALRNLVERYGCIAGYPNQTYRGERAMTRYEFAAGLNACLQQIERLIASSESVLREDIERIQRLMNEFQAELAAIGTRVDNLEGRVAFLEDHQFSTTTKLKGEVVIAAAGAFNNEVGSFENGTVANTPDASDAEDGNQIVANNRVRLNLETSFTGKDLLRVRLQAGDVLNFPNSDMFRLGYATGSNNDVEIDDLFYRFPLGDKVLVHVGANSLDFDQVFDPTNPVLESSGSGALSRFIRYNPLVFRGPQGAGASVKYKFNDMISLTGAYLSDTANNPSEGRGIFNGGFGAGAQLMVSPLDTLDISFVYLHAYEPDGTVNITSSTGSPFGRAPFGNIATTSDRFGLQGSWKIVDKVHIGAWGGYADVKQQKDGSDSIDAWTWAANISVLDLGKEGAIFSVAGGLPPRLATGSSEDNGGDANASYIIEAQYKYPLTKNILLTPGAYVILNPNHDSGNDTVVVGVLRTTFKF